MEIVIKIPESIIEHLKDGSFGARKEDRVTLIDAVMNGTPLPKGHGRLIDADELHHKMGEWLKLSQKADESVMVTLDDIAISTMMEIEEAPTIIEADRGE